MMTIFNRSTPERKVNMRAEIERGEEKRSLKIVEESVEINAPIDKVMAIFKDFEHWPEWAKEFKQTSFVDGGLKPGSELQFVTSGKVAGVRIGSFRMVVVDNFLPDKITLAGATFGLRTIIHWKFERVSHGVTRASQTGEIQGLLGNLSRETSANEDYRLMLTELKKFAEAQQAMT
jgi:hypothetical protein